MYIYIYIYIYVYILKHVCNKNVRKLAYVPRVLETMNGNIKGNIIVYKW